MTLIKESSVTGQDFNAMMSLVSKTWVSSRMPLLSTEAGTPITQDVGRNRDRRQPGAAPVALPLRLEYCLMEGHWRLEVGVPREILLRRFPSAGNDPIAPQSTCVSGLGTRAEIRRGLAEDAETRCPAVARNYIAGSRRAVNPIRRPHGAARALFAALRLVQFPTRPRRRSPLSG